MAKGVNARVLYKDLGKKGPFISWMKDRIKKYGFVEGVDYITSVFKTGKEGCPRNEYVLSEEAAKILIDHENTRIRLRAPVSMEKVALTTIEQVLGIKLQRQYRVEKDHGGWYSIDGYHKESNTAYEIDEPHHSSKERDDRVRQRYITDKLKCKFVRIDLSL